MIIWQKLRSTYRRRFFVKDFVVDEYMIDEAKAAGASAVLLICALLDEETLTRYHKHCDELGLSALVEAHDEEEVQMAVRAGARIIGVNNRNLKDFTVDIHNGIRLREKVPKRNPFFVAESGIKTRENIVELEKGCVNAVLIGETFMRSENKEQMLQQLKRRIEIMAKGRFGIHGGQYIPETLMNAVIELEEAYEHYKKDPEFIKELDTLLHEYVGRPSGLYYAAHMTEDLGGAKIYLKREDLNHTGSHKLNNALGQALLAKKRWERPV